MHEATLFFAYPEPLARAIHGALAPETGADAPKTRSSLALRPDGLHVTLHADDLSALRAALQAWLRWVEAAERAAGAGRVGRA